MKKFICFICLLPLFLSCKKETVPGSIDFRFLDHITLRPIAGVNVESTKGICIVGSNGNQGTCSNSNQNTAITGVDGMARFTNEPGNTVNTKHPRYYDLDRTENPFPPKNEYQLFLKAGADLLLKYGRTDIRAIYISADATDRIGYLLNTVEYAPPTFFMSAKHAAPIKVNGNEAETYVDLLGGIDNNILITTYYSSGASKDTVVNVRPVPNQTMKLTVNIQ
jgi:hypothetical protein